MAGKRRDKGDGSIYFRESDQRWVAKYKFSPDEKPKVLYGKTELEVKKKLREFKKEASKNDYKVIQKTAVRDYLKRWFDDVKTNELKPKSLDSITHTMNNQIFPSIGDIQLDTLNVNDIQTMLNNLVAKGFSYSTIKKAYEVVSSCMKLGVIKGDLLKNPCVGVRLPKNISKRKSEIKILNQEEFELVC